ncbi:MAG: hypothetical protein QY328_07445 [Anaerolineales bacterium]|nr:MAG: hypothetical protein QY328_07445 [Anaerolineales bacterium]
MTVLYTKNITEKAESVNHEMALEILTRKYILGEIRLEEYLEEINKLKTRLDLRKVASKIHTGSLENKLPK